MLIGYARVSTSEQETAAQVTALKAAECERIYREKASGGRWDRPELHRLLDQLRKGDVLVVWKLDRLSRSLRDVLTIMERLAEAKTGFRSLTEAIDTTTPAGRMMMQMAGFSRSSKGPCCASAPRPVGSRSQRRTHRPKLTPQRRAEIICTVSKGVRPQLTRHDCSASIRPRWPACYRERASPAVSSTPNSAENDTPFISESDSRV